jgi:uncharacterized protein (TIGR00369 family)
MTLSASGNGCFACGKTNPIGLKLEFREEGDDYVADWTPGIEHQGYDGIVHGGIVATVLDEAMAKFAWETGLQAVTARLTVSYRKPARVGERMTVRGRMKENNGRTIECEAELVGETTGLIASAEATLMFVKE